MRSFVEQGGTLVADYLSGVFDEHGKARKVGALDDLFGVRRNDEAGYMDGKGLTEIDAEKYEKPFLKRFTHYDGALRHKGIVMFERETENEFQVLTPSSDAPSIIIEKSVDKGKSFYLNLSPLEYWDTERRFSEYGEKWREITESILIQAGLRPRVKVYEKGSALNMIESLFWKNGEKVYLGLVKNPTTGKEKARVGNVQGISGEETEIRLEFQDEVELVDLRAKKSLGKGRVHMDRFRPWEGNLYQVIS